MISRTFVRSFLRVITALFYFSAGVMHLKSPGGFLAITPDWVPLPHAVVFITGVAEIAGAIGLLLPLFQRAAGLGLALYALCVWPANFNHALNDITVSGTQLSWYYHGPRLLFQPVLIWLALWVGGLINWPFRETR